MSLLLDESPLIILPSLAVKLGLNEAIIIQQIHYWLLKSEHNIDGRKWVYNTISKWHKQFPFWSESTIRKTLDKLVKSGIVIKGNYNKVAFDRTIWYSLDYTKICNSQDQAEPFKHIEQMELPNSTTPIPETTTETTAESKEKLKKENDELVLFRKKVIDYLNEKTNAKWKPNTLGTIKRINARLSEGFTLDDFFTCIDKKVDEWYGTEWGKYLVPDTLFSGKMERYVNTKTENEQFFDMMENDHPQQEQKDLFDINR